jgi:hypothetical protein
MKNRMLCRMVALVSLCGAVILLPMVGGCGKTESVVSKEEDAKIKAPAGQPMPPEAREAMQKAGQEAARRQSAGGGAKTP